MNPEFKKKILAEAKKAIDEECGKAGITYEEMGPNARQVFENIFIRGGEAIMKMLVLGQKP